MDSPLRKCIITISGTPCSGKSTVNNLLAKELNCQTHSVGSLVKRLAIERGVEPEAFYEQNGKRQSLDEYLDAYQQQMGEREEDFVLDSRLGFYFVPQSFRVFLSCDDNEAARRVYQARGKEKLYASIEKAKQTITERADLERENYARKYGIPNFRLPCHFDITIDTTKQKPEEIAETILKHYQAYEQRTREIELVRNAFQTIAAEKIIYFSCPITGGKQLYHTLQEHQMQQKQYLPRAVLDGIIRENVQRGKELGKQLQTKTGSALILPVGIGNLGWLQRDYMDLWKEIIRTKATEVVFQNCWEYSDGCVEEYLLSLRLQKPTYTQQYAPLAKENALKLVTAAVEEIHQQHIECSKLDFLLEQLKRH